MVAGRSIRIGVGLAPVRGAPLVPLISNGDFGDASVWAIGSGVSISGGKLTATNGTQICQQLVTYVNGNTYQIDIDYTCTSGSKLRINLAQANGANVVVTSGALTTDGSSQHLTLTYVANVTTDYTSIEADSAVFTGTIDNVSVVRVATTATTVAVTVATMTYQGQVITVNAQKDVAVAFGSMTYTSQSTTTVQGHAVVAGIMTYAAQAITVNAIKAVALVNGAMTYAGQSIAVVQTSIHAISNSTMAYLGRDTIVNAVFASVTWLGNQLGLREKD